MAVMVNANDSVGEYRVPFVCALRRVCRDVVSIQATRGSGVSVVSVLTILRGVGCTEVCSPGGLASLCLTLLRSGQLDGF
jgi:hypothetical protein